VRKEIADFATVVLPLLMEPRPLKIGPGHFRMEPKLQRFDPICFSPFEIKPQLRLTSGIKLNKRL
jgi:hypothetical protein